MATAGRRMPNFMVMAALMVMALCVSAVRVSLKLLVMVDLVVSGQSMMDLVVVGLVWNLMPRVIVNLVNIMRFWRARMESWFTIVMVKVVREVPVVTMGRLDVLVRRMMGLRVIVTFLEHGLLVKSTVILDCVLFTL